MPARRRNRKDREHRITDAAVAAFKAGDYHGLHAALGLKPWQPSPLDPPCVADNVDHRALADGLRQELEKATG
ncbi:MAG: hypothetical protein JWR80_1034 [Bradyrhizobium sp.]|nr:hypothetical protein [Bradyrhizobium sp.]